MKLILIIGLIIPLAAWTQESSDSIFIGNAVLDEVVVSAKKSTKKTIRIPIRGTKKGMPNYLIISNDVAMINSIHLPEKQLNKKLVAVEFFFSQHLLSFPKCSSSFYIKPIVLSKTFNNLLENPPTYIVPKNYNGKFVLPLHSAVSLKDNPKIYVGFSIEEREGKENCNNSVRIYQSDEKYRLGKNTPKTVFSEKGMKRGTLKINLFVK